MGKEINGKKAVIVGASSGIGLALARLMADEGWTLGLAARRTAPLEELAAGYPGRIRTAALDVTSADADAALLQLIGSMGGIDVYVHVAGVGWQNHSLDADRELKTVDTNAAGFARLIGAAYRHFASCGGGHIVAVTSIAGTKGLGAAPAYSASKAFGSTYIEALRQQAFMRGLSIDLTDIRPGFVRTALLDDGRRYPMQMDADRVARSILRSILRRRRVRVIDWRYRILTAIWRFVPSALWSRLRIG